MSQREPDNTPKPDDAPTHERAPGDYYYDDATGYEIYKPDEDDESGNGVSVPPTIAGSCS